MGGSVMSASKIYFQRAKKGGNTFCKIGDTFCKIYDTFCKIGDTFCKIGDTFWVYFI